MLRGSTGGRGVGGHLGQLRARDGPRFGRGFLIALLVRDGGRFEEELAGGSQFLLEVEIGDTLQSRHLGYAVLRNDTLHPVTKSKVNFKLFSNRELAQFRELHRSASWYSSTDSPSAMRVAIRSWQDTQ